MLPRFFVTISPLQVGQSIKLDNKISAHIRALRLRPGALLELFNGNGLCYGTNLLAINNRYCLVQIQSEYPNSGDFGQSGDSEAYFGLFDLPGS